MSGRNLLKLFKFISFIALLRLSRVIKLKGFLRTAFAAFIALFCLSCIKQEQNIVIKVGARVWTLKEAKAYFQARLKSYSIEEELPENLKKELLNELLLRSFVENWAEQQKKQAQKVTLSEQEKLLFLKDKNQLKALRDHKNHLSLYNLLLKELSKTIRPPSLKRQKDFYNKNKPLFFREESCHLKQIVVKKEALANSLHRKVAQGESFDKLSHIYSLKKHPGWIKRGDLEVFDQACFPPKADLSAVLKNHENVEAARQNPKTGLSPVLKSPYGYHIFLVMGKKPSRQKAFPLVQKQIIQILTQEEIRERFQIWLKKQITETPVWTNKKLLDTIHVQYKNSSL